MKPFNLRDKYGKFVGSIPATARQNPEIGYKGFDSNLCCRLHPYTIGECYKINGRPNLCTKGYHYCLTLTDVLNYYDLSSACGNRYCIVAGWGARRSEDGRSSDSKRCTANLKLLRELTMEEVIDILVKESKAANGKWSAYSWAFNELYVESDSLLSFNRKITDIHACYGTRICITGNHNVVLCRDTPPCGQLLTLDGYGNFLYSLSPGLYVNLLSSTQRVYMKGAYSTVCARDVETLIELHGPGSNAITHGKCLVRAPGCCVTLLNKACWLKAVPGTVVVLSDVWADRNNNIWAPVTVRRPVLVLDDSIDVNRWYSAVELKAMAK